MMAYISLAAMTSYCIGFSIVWRHRSSQQILRPNSPIFPLVVMLSIVLHAIALAGQIQSPVGINLNLIATANVVAFVMVVVVAITNTRLPIANLYLLLFPISVVFLLLSLLLEPGAEPLTNISTPLTAHILISLAAYSTLMMAACQSIFLAVQERQLRTPNKSHHHMLPPLETMERLLLAMIWIGLILLTVSILSGFLFLDNMFAQRVVHHTVLTSLSWIAYASFIAGRYLFGWRGLTAVRWSLVAFALLVLGYVGSKFVLEYLIQR